MIDNKWSKDTLNYMEISYPLPEGHIFQEELYNTGTDYLITTLKSTDNYQVCGTIAPIQSNTLQRVISDFAYYKLLSKACPYFSPPVNLHAAVRGEKLHVQQVFNKYSVNKPSSAQLKKLVLQSLKALSLVKKGEYVIHPFMTSYCPHKSTWHICLMKTEYEAIRQVPCWTLSLAHMQLGRKYSEFVDDLVLVQNSRANEKKTSAIALGSEFINEMSANPVLEDIKGVLKYIDYDEKNLSLLARKINKELNFRYAEADWNYNPVEDIEKSVKEDLTFTGAEDEYKVKKRMEVFNCKNLINLLFEFNKWTTENSDELFSNETLEYISLVDTDFTGHYSSVSAIILKNPLIAINIGTLLSKT
eukprot:TRINITY_DN6654_c0_g1_i4.p1 TRINITY_DN6654_c0_g1~~TRINITY_DN6654_c0_g1_i4.p1  ORF type:complete len:360 (-),score=77.67 TRINITY_DN6654_c0_g1_i4:708-1787(-)